MFGLVRTTQYTESKMASLKIKMTELLKEKLKKNIFVIEEIQVGLGTTQELEK